MNKKLMKTFAAAALALMVGCMAEAEVPETAAPVQRLLQAPQRAEARFPGK